MGILEKILGFIRRLRHELEENRTRVILTFARYLFLLLSVAVVCRIIEYQYFWEPIKESVKYFSPTTVQKVIDPVRGSILAHDGRILASATPMYRIEMDCTVMKDAFANNGDEGKEQEKQWRAKAKELAAGLQELIGEKSADTYYNEIISRRVGNKKSYRIADQIDHDTLLKLKELPLFNESSYRGGLVISKLDTRQYPYGSLARRAIGYIKNNKDTVNNKLGIEGKYDKILHGKEGLKYMKVTDNHKRVPDMDSTAIKVEDGFDVRTTLDIDIQSIADRALRRFFLDSQSSEKIIEGCTIVMEVKTGAIRAMVNLKKEADGSIGENFNYAVGRKGEPGSVFKVVSLMTALEDGKIKSLRDSVPTFKGLWTYAGKLFDDTEHLNARRFPDGYIRLEDALMISSNNAFRYLIAKNYEKEPDKYIEKVRKYGFLDNFEFDLKGLAETKLPVINPKEIWTYQDLAQLGMGYAVELTPIHLLTFYNGIANGGKMMKPYLVEDIEKNGHIKERKGPKVLNSSMCRKATTDTLKRGLLRVTSTKLTGSNMGTAYYAFRGAKCSVAGKTGTARMKVLANAKKGDPYQTADGRRQFQATFVGFFPAENPKYSMITVVYSKPIIGNLYGSACANVAREISDAVYCLDPEWGEEYHAEGKLPQMKKADEKELTAANEVPDVKGLGLMDALFAIENSGFRCNYSGTGHVVSQSPQAHSKTGKGQTVNITLR